VLGRPRKKKIISRLRGYHGITVASGSLTGIFSAHRNFDLPLPQMRHAECPDFYTATGGPARAKKISPPAWPRASTR
jgi:adenosylmethionine-8-amino-7-oxononanoate aminotransferase